MADIRPFQGVYYNQSLVKDLAAVLCPPYDIITPQMQQDLYQRSDGNFVRIEFGRELPQDRDTENKYTRSAATLEKWLQQDILKIDPGALLEQEKEKFPPRIEDPLQYRVVANLPYYITAPVLRHFLEASVKPGSMVVMVQKEVAETIAARPGRMSLLSVSVQYYGEPAIVSTVPAHCFYPEPEVDSAILKIDVYPQPVISVSDEKGFFNLVRAGFSASRKQIVNSLALGLSMQKPEVLDLLEKSGIAPQRRPETLNLEEWARMWQLFSGTGEPC